MNSFHRPRPEAFGMPNYSLLKVCGVNRYVPENRNHVDPADHRYA